VSHRLATPPKRCPRCADAETRLSEARSRNQLLAQGLEAIRALGGDAAEIADRALRGRA
jgi:hypothetical protein